MKKIEPKILKGFRDFLPNEARKRQYVLNTLKQVFESYGFEPLETSALEYEEILLGKYGKEGDKLMYRFTDRGNRKVALRYDQTVPLARVVAQYGNELPMPFKRYQIQNVWRAENPQKGRYREFLQCDIDTVGTKNILADSEIITCTLTSMKKLGFKNVYMEVNDRSVFKGIEPKYITIIDKLKKIGKDKVLQELQNKGLSKNDATLLLYRIKVEKKTSTLNKLFSLLKTYGFDEDKDFKFTTTLARGLDYYTGLIFELFVPQYGDSSLGGGGRYDNLIGMFSGRQIPAVGFAFGFDRLIEAMTELKLFPENVVSPKVKVLVTIFNSKLLEKSIQTTLLLYRNKVAAELYLDENASLEKQLKYADKKGIPYAIIIGPTEASKNLVTLRNMKKREQKTFSVEEAIKTVIKSASIIS